MFLIFNFLIFLCLSLQAAEYDSALAPYPYLRTEPYSASTEEILKKVEANAPDDGGFSATISWSYETEKKLNLDKNNYGPFSLKSCPNWHTPSMDGFWKSGTYNIKGGAGDFRIEKPEDNLSAPDWWQKEGENIYARAFSNDCHSIWRFHHDALETDMLGYCEGLGLLLWAFQPTEYLRRAENLEIGTDREINGKSYKTLVATPNWIKTPLFLENRSHYPFNHSTIISWANLKPVITYFVDPDLDTIIAAEFVYYNCYRSHPKDWKTVAKPGGLVIFCMAEELAQTGNGTWCPTKITGEVYQDEDLVRQTNMNIKLGETATSINAPTLSEKKRMIDPWPLYRSEVYKNTTLNGVGGHADFTGLAQALCYEKADREAESALFNAVSGLEEDFKLAPSTFGGIDWELGFALYEIFWRYNEQDLEDFWKRAPRTSTWSAILARGVKLYQKYRPKEAERIESLLDFYYVNFEEDQIAQIEKEMLEDYRTLLQADIDKLNQKGRIRAATHLEKLLEGVETELNEIR